MNTTRRDFLRKTSIAGAGLAMLPNITQAGELNPAVPFGATYMGDFAAPTGYC